jgi:hypothetical protein
MVFLLLIEQDSTVGLAALFREPERIARIAPNFQLF